MITVITGSIILTHKFWLAPDRNYAGGALPEILTAHTNTQAPPKDCRELLSLFQLPASPDLHACR